MKTFQRVGDLRWIVCLATILLLQVARAGLPEGWRFVGSLPQGNSFNAAWAAAEDDLFIGGEGGVILRWNGQSWTTMSTPTQKTIFAMHGLSPTDVWAVGGDPYAETQGDHSLILHFDGTSWKSMTPPTFWDQTYVLNSVFAIAPNDVWATVDSSIHPIHYDGQSWSFAQVTFPASTQMEGSLKGVAAVDANHVFFSGSHGQILHRSGTQWILEQKKESGGFSADLLTHLWAPALDRVYVGGNWGQVYRRNADGTWTDLELRGGFSPSYSINHIWGRSPTEIHFVSGELIRRYDGVNPPVVTSFTNKRGYWYGGAHAGSSLFCFGRAAVHQHQPDANNTQLSSLTVGGGTVPYASIDGLVPLEGERFLGWGDTVYVPGAAALFTLDNGSFHAFPSRPAGMEPNTRVSAVHASGPDDIVVCWDNWEKPGNGIHRWNGIQWLAMQGRFTPEPFEFTHPPTRAIKLWRSSSGTFFAIETHRFMRTGSDGVWEKILDIPFDLSPPRTLSALWGRSDTEVYLGTDQGEIFLYNGSTLTRHTTPGGGAVRAIGGNAQGTYAVGFNGRAWYRDGSTWKRMANVLEREEDNFTAIATGTRGTFAFQQTPSRYTGGGLGRLWRLDGSQATRVIQGISGGNDARLVASSNGNLFVVAGPDYILTDQPAPATFSLQLIDRTRTDWIDLGPSGASIQLGQAGSGTAMVAAWRLDEAATGIPDALLGDRIPTGQRWIIRTEQWRQWPNFIQALPPVRVRLQYDPDLLPGSGIGDPRLFRYDGASWSALDAALVAPNALESIQPSALSDWAFAVAAPEPEPVPVEIQLTPEGQLRVSWPASSDLTLQSRPDLNPGTTWTPVGPAGGIEGDRRVVALPASGSAGFFRLAR